MVRDHVIRDAGTGARHGQTGLTDDRMRALPHDRCVMLFDQSKKPRRLIDRVHAEIGRT